MKKEKWQLKLLIDFLLNDKKYAKRNYKKYVKN
jgi:hypothetical protein